ncbi:hypothetical protein, partial [Frankia sp. AvcI1]
EIRGAVDAAGYTLVDV